MEDHVVKKSIEIRAEPSKVWEALTNPEKTKQYFFNAEVISDWQVGSPITFKGRMFLFMKYELHGKILQIEREKLLKYTLKNSNSTGFSTVTDQLSYANGLTTLSITDDVGTEDGAQQRYERSVKGWDKILTKLKQIAEA